MFGSTSAVWAILIALFGANLVESLSFLNILVGPIVASVIFAAAPTFLNAAVVPMAISTLNDEAGMASGKCFSISTVGSIVGVVATGYILLPFLGISGTLLSGAALFFIALILYKPKAIGLAGLAVVLVLAFFTGNADLPKDTLVDYSNGYHRLQITETQESGKTKRTIYLDSTIEGIATVGEVSSYLPGVTNLTQSLEKLDSALIIGGGAFSTPRYIKEKFPNARVDVIELDPDVEKYAREYLELGDSINVFIGDGRNVLSSLDQKYDLIFNDAFRGYKNIPAHLTTVEFNQLVQSKLNDGGHYAINVRGYPQDSYLAASLLKTLSAGFPHLRETGQSISNTITLASTKPTSLGKPLNVDFSEGFLLTDNRAPTEMLIVLDLIRKKIGV